MAKKKTTSVEKLLGNLTPEQRKAFAEQYNNGLGSGLTPEQYKKKYGGNTGTTAKKKPAAKKK